MKACQWCLALSLTILGLSLSAYPQASCSAISVPQPPPGANMFNAQQEAALGDAMDAALRQTTHVVQDVALTLPFTVIAGRLEAQMPPGHPQFRVNLYDSNSADAFSLPGHIYVSRKLVALTRNEDEMAGILAHEMGHLLAHHSAITATENFHRVLNVTQVGDDADVVAKWNLYLSNYKRVRYTSVDAARAHKSENQHQEQADSIALSLVGKAGYSVQAFVDVFDRIAETQGKTGNFWTDLFGDTTPDAKRLRQMARERPALLADCIMAHGDSVPHYAEWRAKVIENQPEARSVKVTGLISQRRITERLRPEIGHIRISPDGKYALAQDDSNIFVLTRSPLKSVFHIFAPDAQPAQFSPDSSGIVFHFARIGASPRVERWDIASQKRVEVHEIYIRRGCMLSNLSPDGRTLVCVGYDSTQPGVSFDLDLFDTASGSSFYHKKDWIFVSPGQLTFAVLWKLYLGLALGNQQLYDAVSHIAISPDGRFLVGHTSQNTLAMDLTTRTAISIPGSVKDLMSYGHFTFLDASRFMGVGGNQGEKSSVVEFPSGRAIFSNIMIGDASVSRVARGDYVLLRPIKDNPLGVVDLKQNKIVLQSKRSAFDIWDNQGLSERENGDLVVIDLATAKFLDSTPLPDAQLGGVRAAAVSPDLSWLAVSQNSRGAVWNVQTGQRLYHVRGFHGASFAQNGPLIVDFPKHLKTERSIVGLALDHDAISPRYTLDEKEHALQDGRYLIVLVPADDKIGPNRNVTFEIRDVANRDLLWSRHFAQERPGYFVDANTNSLILYWQAGSKEIQSLVKQDSAAAAKLAPFKSREGIDYVEVVDLDSGKQRFAMAIDTGKNSIRVADMVASSDRLVLGDDNGRLLVFDEQGSPVSTLAGSRPEISLATNLLSAHTQNGELTLYNLQTLQPRATHNFDSRVAYSAFSADGTRLLVLSGNQSLYLIDTTAH